MTLPPGPDCNECGGTGFVVLWDFDGPGLHDEDNCQCGDLLESNESRGNKAAQTQTQGGSTA